MNYEEYENMFKVERDHWWYKGVRTIVKETIKDYLPAMKPAEKLRILDAGCGTGITFNYFQELGDITGIDISPLALDFCQRRGIKKLCRADSSKLPFKNNSFDLIIALDLLEHIENDSQVIAEFHRILRPDGLLLLNCPALQSLWSHHDVAMMHFRRYSKKMMLNLFKTDLFSLKKLTYYNSLLLPPIYLFRSLKKTFAKIFGNRDLKNIKSDLNLMPPALANYLLYKLFSLELPLVKRYNLPLGVSLLVIAQKKYARFLSN